MALAAEFGRDLGRDGEHQPEAEDQRQEIDVGAERAGGKRIRPEPAHHEHVGRGHRGLAEIGQDHRPAQRQHCADFATPRIFRCSRTGLDGSHWSVFRVRSRQNFLPDIADYVPDRVRNRSTAAPSERIFPPGQGAGAEEKVGQNVGNHSTSTIMAATRATLQILPDGL
jgi:hypothetical protein